MRALPLRDIAFILLTISVAVLAPLFYGTTSVRSVSVALAILSCALVISPLHSCGWRDLRKLAIPLLLFALYIGLALAQSVAGGLPPSPIWGESAPLLDAIGPATFSVDPDRTQLAIGLPLLLGVGLLCGFGLSMRQGGGRRFLAALAVAGSAYAVLGLAMHLSAPGYVLMKAKTTHFGSLTGTFFNRNAEAAFLGLCAIAQLSLLLDGLRFRSRDARGVLGIGIPRLDRRTLWLLAALLPVAVALMMTESRAGVGLTFASTILCCGSKIFLGREARRGRGRRSANRIRVRLFGLAIAFATAFLAIGIDSGGMGDRIRKEGLGDAARGYTYESVFRLIGEKPWSGYGIGTFELVFPAERNPEGSILGIWNRAHSSLLEIAVEAGVPLAAAIAGCVAFIVLMLLRAFARRPERPILIAAPVILLQASLHSLVDYPLQIPAIGLIVAMVTGAALGAAARIAPRSERPERSQTASGGTARIA